MNGRDRLMAALRGDRPDRVPYFDLYIDPKVIHALYPGLSYEDFVEAEDIGAIRHDILYEAGSVKSDSAGWFSFLSGLSTLMLAPAWSHVTCCGEAQFWSWAQLTQNVVRALTCILSNLGRFRLTTAADPLTPLVPSALASPFRREASPSR